MLWAVAVTSQFEAKRSERMARTARAVDDILTRAAWLRGKAQASPVEDLSRWSEALAAAREADYLVKQGETDAPTRLRVAELLATLGHERQDAQARAVRRKLIGLCWPVWRRFAVLAPSTTTPKRARR